MTSPTPLPVRRKRGGFVLPLFLMLLLALTLLGHGTLILAELEIRAVRAFQHSVRAGYAAEGGIVGALDHPEGLPGPPAIGAHFPLPSGWFRGDLWSGASLRWLSTEFFLLEGTGRSRGWGGIRKLAAVGWALDPVTRVGAFGAGIESDGGLFQSPGAEVSASSVLELPHGWDSIACEGFRGELDSLFSGSPLLLRVPLPPGDTLVPGVLSPIPPLGLLPGLELLSRGGDPRLPPAGALTAPGCPPSEEAVFWSTGSDLEVGGGQLCGLLVVEGDLRIKRDASVQGLVLVGGNLFLDAGGRFEGLARVRGAVRVESTATLNISGCPVIRALSQVSELLKPLVLPGASRIPLF